MHWGLQQILNGTNLSKPALSGLRVGLEHGDLETFEFGIDTESGPLSIQLHGVNANYDLRVPEVESISMAYASLKFTYRPQEKPETETVSRVPPFPLQRLSVEHLDLEIETPWGLSHFAGQAEIGRGKKNALEAKFLDAKQSVRLELDSDLRTVKAILEQTPGGKVFELNANQLDQTLQHAALDANAGSLLGWLSSSELVPETLRAKMKESDSVRLGPGIASMSLKLTADTQDRFDSLQGRLMLTQEGNHLASANVTVSPRHSMVDVDGHMDMAAAEAVEVIRPWLPETFNSWRISAGRAQGNLKLRWQPDRISAGTADLKAHAVTLTATAVNITGADLELNIEDISRRSMTLSVVVPNLTLGEKTELQNLAIKAQLLNSALTLEKATLPVFGGIVEVLPDTVNIDQRPINLTLGVRNVDLSQLLDSLNYHALSGTGTISGKLPLSLTEDAIELQGGALQGTRPGVIQYQGPVGDDENLAFKALRNLVYHSLRAEVNYRPNGDYRLGLRLEGSNPDVLSGHPLAFNLNLSGQLPELLQKGIRAGNFEQSILEQATSAPAKNQNVTMPSLKPH